MVKKIGHAQEKIVDRILGQMAPLDILSGYLDLKDNLDDGEVFTVRETLRSVIANIYDSLDDSGPKRARRLI